MTIGENIRKFRRERKISQQKLGQELGVSQAMIAQYETGKRIPKLDTIGKIAYALNVTRDSLLTDTSTNEKTEVIRTSMEDMLKNMNFEITDIKQMSEEGTLEILEQRHEYMHLYDKLNALGQKKAIERVEELTEIPRYAKEQKN